MRIALALISVAALVFWSSQVCAPVIAYLRARGSHLTIDYLYYAFFPIIYLLYFLVSCTMLLRFRASIMIGIAIHLALIAWIIVDLTHPSFVTTETTGAAILFAAFWIFWCLQQIRRRFA
jgi:hypothetical protein